jgi:ribosomal protein L7/L12
MPRCTACGHDNPAQARNCDGCGADLPRASGPVSLSDGLVRQVRTLVAEGRKIEAIKVYRGETGVGLKEAKDAVEAIERGQPFPSPEKVDVPFERELVTLLGEGKKIEAIKRYRERTGAGLKEAKDAVEALGVRHGLPVTHGSGCLGGIALFVTVVAGAVAWNLVASSMCGP